MSWWEIVVDAVPVVGAGYRSVRAVTAHVCGDHEEAQKQWQEAGMNIAGDALGLVTGGAGKFAAVGAKAVAKTAIKAGAKTAFKTVTKGGLKSITKQTLKQAAKKGTRAAVRAGRKQLSRKGVKKFAKKYVKKQLKKERKKAQKKIKEGIKDAIAGGGDESSEDNDEQGDDYDKQFSVEMMHFFSGTWKGCYRQGGANHEVLCNMIIDWDGQIAGEGKDSLSGYTMSGQLGEDGSFKFEKKYIGPTCFHSVMYTGTVEWTDQPVLQGEWCIKNQRDAFVLTLAEVGLEAAVVSLSCLKADAVLRMNTEEIREEIVQGLVEVTDWSYDEFQKLSDKDLIDFTLAITSEEDCEDEDEDEN